MTIEEFVTSRINCTWADRDAKWLLSQIDKLEILASQLLLNSRQINGELEMLYHLYNLPSPNQPENRC